MGSQPSYYKQEFFSVSSPSRQIPHAKKQTTTPALADPRHLGSALAAQHGYERFLRPAKEDEAQQVMGYYLECPVPGWDVASVEVVDNAPLSQLFRNRIALLQANHDHAPSNVPSWIMSSSVRARFKVLQQMEEFAQPYAMRMFPSIKFLPLWYSATNASELSTIVEFGYVGNSGGSGGRGAGGAGRGGGVGGSYCGEGLILSREAEYASRVLRSSPPLSPVTPVSSSRRSPCEDSSTAEELVLVLNWVALGSPYPVIGEDSGKLRGKTRLESYDGLFTPVVPCRKSYEEETYFRPLSFRSSGVGSGRDIRVGVEVAEDGVEYLGEVEEETAKYTEVCVFEPLQCIPRFVLRLRRVPSKSGSKWKESLTMVNSVSEECLSNHSMCCNSDACERFLTSPKQNLSVMALQRHEELLLFQEMDFLLEQRLRSGKR